MDKTVGVQGLLETFGRKESSDFNRVPYGALPKPVSERFLSFESVPLKSSKLILTSRDKTSREILYNCFDISDSGGRFSGFQTVLKHIQTLRPAVFPAAMLRQAPPGMPEFFLSVLNAKPSY